MHFMQNFGLKCLRYEIEEKMNRNQTSSDCAFETNALRRDIVAGDNFTMIR